MKGTSIKVKTKKELRNDMHSPAITDLWLLKFVCMCIFLAVVYKIWINLIMSCLMSTLDLQFKVVDVSLFGNSTVFIDSCP